MKGQEDCVYVGCADCRFGTVSLCFTLFNTGAMFHHVSLGAHRVHSEPPRGCVGSRAAASAPLIHCEDHKHPDTLTQRKTSVGAWPAPDFVSRYLHLPDGSSFCSSKHGVSSRPGRRQDSRPPRMPLLAWCARITSHPDHTSKESLSACTQALRLSYLLTPRKRTWCAGLVLHWSIIVTGCGLHAPTHDT